MDLIKIFESFIALLFLPLASHLVQFAAGEGDPLGMLIMKWVFLMLPLLSLIWAYWVSMISLATIIIRSERNAFLTKLLMTWWDLGHSILSFWSGTLRFVLKLVFVSVMAVRFVVLSACYMTRDLFMIPLRTVSQMGDNVINRGVPWIAIALTLFWSTLEATIFTYVMTPLVLDTLSNMTGSTLTEQFVRIPLFMFMFFIVLGSYSVLSTWTQALATKNIPSIIKIGVIEFVAMFVEVVFLYREFVDALVPWFAQHSSGNFELGIAGTLAIAGITWFGVRAISWFLFASSGTPTIMAIIQGTGIKFKTFEAVAKQGNAYASTDEFMKRLKGDEEWLRAQTDELVAAFILPPLQIVACAINFATVLLTTQQLFSLPFNNLHELREARVNMQKIEKRKAS
jgi:hypothetical protein